MLVFYQVGKKFQNQGFPQQRLHTIDMDDKYELSLDKSIHFHVINPSIQFQSYLIGFK